MAPLIQTPPPPPPLSVKPSPVAQPAKTGSTTPYDAGSTTFDISKIIAMESDEFLKRHYPVMRKEPELRLTPSLGRTVHVHGNVDMAHAIRKLEQLIKLNKVKFMSMQQRFHERPGLKRKRLKSSRWRVRFRGGFNAAVSRVLELKKQGW